MRPRPKTGAADGAGKLTTEHAAACWIQADAVAQQVHSARDPKGKEDRGEARESSTGGNVQNNEEKRRRRKGRGGSVQSIRD